MKFKNVEVGIVLQHKETGLPYRVNRKAHDGDFYFLLSNCYIDARGHESNMLLESDAKLFRKYKDYENV